MLNKHSTRTLFYKGKNVKIDRKIATLISNMWKLNINTINCCQEHCSPNCKHTTKIITYKDGSKLYKKIRTRYCNKFIWIVFDRPKDAELFFNIVAEFDSSITSMYSRIHGYNRSTEHFSNTWVTEVMLENRGEIRQLVRHKNTIAYGKNNGNHFLWEEKDCKRNKFNLMIQLYFPIKHLKYVEERIKLALDRRKNEGKI